MTPPSPSHPPLPAEDLRQVLALTAPLWDEARGKAFFITGGTGFFGVWLLESWAHANDTLALGCEVTVLTRNPDAARMKMPHIASRSDVTFIRGDIRDFPYPEKSFDYIIHAATEASAKLNSEAPEVMIDSIVAGMKRVLEFTGLCGARKMLFTSSGAVYGPQPADLENVPEDFTGGPDCLNPGSAYGEGKRIAELMAAIHGRKAGCEVKIARCWAFHGPHLPLDTHFAIGNFIRDARAGKPIRIAGDGSPFRSYLYASDLAAWLWTILFTAPALRPYNVGSDQAISIAELAGVVNSAVANPAGIEIARVPDPSVRPSRYVPSCGRAGSELRLAPTVTLEDGLRRTLRWLRETPAGNAG